MCKLHLRQKLLLLIFGVCLSVCAEEIPWHLSEEGADVAPASIASTDIKPGAYKITVAVIDSGLLAGHPSLTGKILPGYDMVSAPNNLRGDRSSNFAPDGRDSLCKGRVISNASRTHGTEVASLIAGNGVYGVFGVNVNARIVPIRVFGACGSNRKDLIDSLAWAAGWPVSGAPINANPAKIINLSISGGLPSCGQDLQSVVDKLIDHGIFIVSAAGNNFHKSLQEPANCRGVISVGALDANNQIAVYSALDSRIVLYAPGGGRRLTNNHPWGVNKIKIATYDQDLLGREESTGESRGIGTSFAAPIVSGFISLWLSYKPDKIPSELERELPKFLRDVEPIADCMECNPKGLNASFLK